LSEKGGCAASMTILWMVVLALLLLVTTSSGIHILFFLGENWQQNNPECSCCQQQCSLLERTRLSFTQGKEPYPPHIWTVVDDLCPQIASVGHQDDLTANDDEHEDHEN